MNADGFRLLFEYNVWANHMVLEKTAEVADSEDYEETSPGISFGNLHLTLLHLVDTERAWFRRWRGEDEVDPLAVEDFPDFSSLRDYWRGEEESQRHFLAGLTDEAVANTITFSFRSGRVVTQPLWQLMVHLINHSTQFRSEAAVRLTQLGKSPGNLDLFIFLRQQSSPAP